MPVRKAGVKMSRDHFACTVQPTNCCFVRNVQIDGSFARGRTSEEGPAGLGYAGGGLPTIYSKNSLANRQLTCPATRAMISDHGGLLIIVGAVPATRPGPVADIVVAAAG